MQGSTAGRALPWFDGLRNAVEAAVVWMFARSAVSSGQRAGERIDAYYSREELEQIVLRYKDMVYRLAVMRMKSRDLADDIFQETFLRLVRQTERFSSEEQLKAWLLRVAINCCNDYYRSAWNRKVVPFMDERKKGDTEESGDDDDSASTDGVYEAFDTDDPLAEATFEAVESLSDNLRTVVHMFYYENMSVREIALATGARENAVKTRLSRARDILKGKLEVVYHG